MPAVLPDLSSCRRVLVIKPSSLGDIVHTLPSVHLLKRKFPDTEFTWLVNPAFAPLLEGNPDLDGTLLFPRENFRGMAGLGRFVKWLRALPEQIRPDAAIDFQGLLRSGLTARASGAPVRAGFSDSREGARFFHTHVVPVEAGAHAIERSLALPRALGADSGALEFPLPQGNCPAALHPETLSRQAVLLHPFSRGKGKSLTAAQVIRFCQEMAPLPVMLAGRGGEPLPDGSLPGNVINLLDRTTLPELVWLIRRSAAVVSVDSGPMHIAAALTPKVLSLHTWSDPRKVGPWHAGTTVWKAGHLMAVESLDPGFCAQAMEFPDKAVPQVASWAREAAGQSSGG